MSNFYGSQKNDTLCFLIMHWLIALHFRVQQSSGKTCRHFCQLNILTQCSMVIGDCWLLKELKYLNKLEIKSVPLVRSDQNMVFAFAIKHSLDVLPPYILAHKDQPN